MKKLLALAAAGTALANRLVDRLDGATITIEAGLCCKEASMPRIFRSPKGNRTKGCFQK